LRFNSITSVSVVFAECSVVLDALVHRVLLRAAGFLGGGGGLWSGCKGRVVPALRRHPARVAGESLLDSDSVSEALEGVSSLQSLELGGSILIDELVDGQVATSDLDLDFVLLDTDSDALLAELVDALSLSQEHDLQLCSVRVVVDILCELPVDRVSLGWDVDCDAGLEVDDVALEGLDFVLGVFQTLEQVK